MYPSGGTAEGVSLAHLFHLTYRILPFLYPKGTGDAIFRIPAVRSTWRMDTRGAGWELALQVRDDYLAGRPLRRVPAGRRLP